MTMSNLLSTKFNVVVRSELYGIVTTNMYACMNRVDYNVLYKLHNSTYTVHNIVVYNIIPLTSVN